jgi:DNA-binding PadR family transcriptional regulator
MKRDKKLTRHFFAGFIRLHVLYHAAKEPVYGAEIAEELRRHGYSVSFGTLYPSLHLLEELGYLTSREELIAGRRRRSYRATAAGRRALKSARKQLRELIAEVLEDDDRGFRAIRRKHRS